MTQKEFFKKANTDHLLSMRFASTCRYPQNEGDKPDFSNDGLYWYINKTWLYEKLALRPHRIRAKSRRKLNQI